MDTFMCSSWYHLRYLGPKYDRGPFDPKEYDYWMPVDTYTGGAEHATMHLIYTRFFHKAMRDSGVTEGHEPMLQLRNQGQILGPDGQRMSKSRGNVIDPDEQVRIYGADTVRCYLMFGYRWSEGGPWNTENIQGVVRWLNRTWSLFSDSDDSGRRNPTPEVAKALRRKVHQTLKRVTRDLEQFEFNTVISSLMELMNEMYRAREAGASGTPEWAEAQDYYLRMMAPVAPHIAEELWTESMKKPYSVHQQPWPQVDEAAAKEDEITIPIQINGKLRDRIVVPADAAEEQVKAAALASENVKKHLEGKKPRKVIYVKGKLVSIVV
jgi:leucyl-tRNA synthetase